MFVYTFWEPRENIPFYLRLCMETWKKFLPNATIVVLDYKNIGEFLDVRELGLNLFSDKRFSLMHVADAIRIALLAKYGGVWLDADTIVLNSNAEKYFLPDEKHRTIFFGELSDRSCHVAFINTPPNAMCMNLWREFIRERIWNLKPSTPVNWDFLSNIFIDEYAKIHKDEIEILDRNLVRPELQFISNPSFSEWNYIDYYFLKNHHLADVEVDMLLLHNSWTPDAFKNLSPEEFLRCDCTMTNVLAEALEITLPPPHLRFQIKVENQK